MHIDKLLVKSILKIIYGSHWFRRETNAQKIMLSQLYAVVHTRASSFTIWLSLFPFLFLAARLSLTSHSHTTTALITLINFLSLFYHQNRLRQLIVKFSRPSDSLLPLSQLSYSFACTKAKAKFILIRSPLPFNRSILGDHNATHKCADKNLLPYVFCIFTLGQSFPFLKLQFPLALTRISLYC